MGAVDQSECNAVEPPMCAAHADQGVRMPYRYKLVFDVVIDGDGQHAAGGGAYATYRRLQDAIKADPRVVRLGSHGPRWMGDGAASDQEHAVP